MHLNFEFIEFHEGTRKVSDTYLCESASSVFLLPFPNS